jgi:hypothetical protein
MMDVETLSMIHSPEFVFREPDSRPSANVHGDASFSNGIEGQRLQWSPGHT